MTGHAAEGRQPPAQGEPLSCPEVLLISKDPHLCRLVQNGQPAGATLRIITDGAAAIGVRRSHVWVDLDTATDPATLPGPRVFFCSAATAIDQTGTAGRFVRKPANAALIDLLWAAVTEPGARNRRAPRADAGLPRWALEFQDLRLRRFCRRVSTRLPDRLGYQDISIYLYDGARNVFTLAESTLKRPIDLILRAHEDSDRLMVAVATRGKLIETRDVAATRTALGIRPPAEARLYSDAACLIAPLICEGQLFGVICLSTRIGRVERAQRTPRVLLFRYLSRCLMHATEHERVQSEARVDGLTGLYNVRYLTEVAEREVRRTARFQQPLTVIAIDLDGLKGVNDRHGHAAGDFVLRHVSRAIVGVLRQCDIAARVGGDEFVALLPATALEGGKRVALRLIESLRDESPAYRGIPLSVRASVGVTQWQSGWNVQQFLEAADQALYDAKTSGRDQVVLRGPDTARSTGPSRFAPEPAMPNLVSLLPHAMRRDAT